MKEILVYLVILVAWSVVSIAAYLHGPYAVVAAFVLCVLGLLAHTHRQTLKEKAKEYQMNEKVQAKVSEAKERLAKLNKKKEK